MEIKIRSKDNVVILDFFGQIDVNSANLVEVVGQCLHDGYLEILCNFEEISNIDYMGISAIVIAYKDVVNKNGRMKFVKVPAHLKNLFGIAGLDRAIEIFAEEDEAINAFKEDKAIEEIKRLQLRRRFKRLPVGINIELKHRYKEGATCWGAEIVNISAVGAFVFGCRGFKLGDEVLLKFKLPPSYEEIELGAKVVWFADKQVQPHLFPGVGIEFVNISMELQAKIIEFIERNAAIILSEDQPS